MTSPMSISSREFKKLNQPLIVASHGSLKKAALLFDKVWWPYSRWETKDKSDRVPAELVIEINDATDEIMYELKYLMKRINEEYWIDVHAGRESQSEYTGEYIPFYFTHNVSRVLNAYGLNVVPIFNSWIAFEKKYPQGETACFQACLDSISVVDESSLSWEQVVNFRNDKKSLRKYRALRLWLLDAIQGKTLNEARDIIETKVEHYEWALKKHGFKTVIGALNSIVDTKTLSAIAAGAGVSALIGGPTWSAITTGALLASKISTFIADWKIGKEDIKRGPNSEVAIIYDIKNEFKKKPNKTNSADS